MSLKDLLNNHDKKTKVGFEKKGKAKKITKPEMRIIISQANVKKFKEVFLYILEKVGARPNIGETALYKLLYFIDFDYYEKYQKHFYQRGI